MAQEKTTFCRICEPGCSLVAALDDNGRVQSLRPNLDDPIGGVACHKGPSYLAVHNDPDRLNWPRRRKKPPLRTKGPIRRCGMGGRDRRDRGAHKVADR
ncbi:hypothetical protein ACFSTD_02315 [Novosphingobium colocasiae]